MVMPLLQNNKLLTANRFINFNFKKEEELHELAEIAAVLFSVKFVVISIAGHHKHYVNKKFKSKGVSGLNEQSLFRYLVLQQKTVIIEDADAKKTFKHQPIAINKRAIRFYASIPLITHDGHYAGNFLLMDYVSRKFKKSEIEQFNVLVKQILNHIELDYSLRVIKEQHNTAKETEIKLRSFFESSAACHLLIGKELEVLVFNRNMAEFIEKHHRVTLYPGINVAKILHEAYLQDFIKDYEKALSGTPIKYEREVEYADATIWWYVTFEPGYNSAGEIVGISYNATDITERKHQEKKILAQNSSLSTIAHIQSHELRRPVASILGLMYIFKHEGYKATTEEMMMLEKAVDELDEKIKEIVKISSPV